MQGDGANVPDALHADSHAIMPNALTPAQFEIMRRVRDDGTLLDGEPVANMTRELGFLFSLELLGHGPSGILILSELGTAYLAAAELEGARTTVRATSGDPPSDTSAKR